MRGEQLAGPLSLQRGPVFLPAQKLGEGRRHSPKFLFITLRGLHHQILIQEGDMQSVVFAKGRQRNMSGVGGKNAEEEQNSLITSRPFQY